MSTTKWSIDPTHSEIGFKVKHMMFTNVSGKFGTYDATITTDGDNFENAAIEFSADIASVDTANADRDGHLRSADFFDAEKYPTLTFKSTSFKKVSGKNYKVTGDLTLHGVTKAVTLNAVFNGTTTNPMSKKTEAGFKFTGTIKRSDFGIAAAMPATMLGDEVTITGNGEFVKE